MISTILSLPRYRYAVLFIILVLTLYISFFIKKYGRDKISFHADVIDFITYVKRQITFFCTPTDKIISGYAFPGRQDGGIFEEGGIDKNVYLDERGKKLLKDFFSKLGRSSAEDQTANCDYTIDALNSLLDEYEEELPKKYKAYSTLVLIAGAMLMVLLL